MREWTWQYEQGSVSALKDTIFAELEELCAEARVPRNAYLNQTIDFYDHINRRRLLKKQLSRESAHIRSDSASILMELDSLEDGIIE